MADNEADIHCNVIQCRKPLRFDVQACVTSCSHIFCIECANRNFSHAPVCPACNTQLNESDDIVVTHLNPSEEYKSSVLAGLKPDIIMDICSRSISFYHYQTSQELCFRTILQKNLEMKYDSLQAEFNDLAQDTARHLKVEKEKTSMAAREYETEKERVHELKIQLQEKGKQFHKLQTMYEKLKRKIVMPSVQTFNPQQQQQQQQQPPPPPHSVHTTSMGPTPFVSSSAAFLIPKQSPYPTTTSYPHHPYCEQQKRSFSHYPHHPTQPRMSPPPPPPPLSHVYPPQSSIQNQSTYYTTYSQTHGPCAETLKLPVSRQSKTNSSNLSLRSKRPRKNTHP